LKEKSLFYFHKKLKILKKPKKNQKSPFLVGFLGGFFWVFLGGFFWVGFLMPTLHTRAGLRIGHFFIE
jgi:hypothetical protein